MWPRNCQVRALGKRASAAETSQLVTSRSAPTMAADAWYPLIWNAVSKLWHDGDHGSAVQRPATWFYACIQNLTNDEMWPTAHS